ncbi:CBS domain-containing protein [Candidatus Bathyarchaeota archaeon A05DMB-2]|jgi:CBS domain-containing protein|nr:CBS domain-containing protein [Candidatus Bathyarchaeota archaeon A05DMB-2]
MAEDEETSNIKITLKVEDVMTREIITIDENATVKEAAEIMNQNDISCLIASRNGRAIGIITERDLLKRVIVEAKNAKKTKVAEVMSTPLEVITPDTSLEEAVRVMFEKKIKKLPVIEKKQIIGLVSLTDIARCQPAIMKILKSFANVQNAPKSMKKVLDMYIV